MTDRFDAAGLEAKVRAHVERNMDAATLWLKGQVQRSINRGNADGSNPSAAGEPPKKVSGRLFQSIATAKEVSPSEIVGKVGANVEYAKRLEFGFEGTEQVGAHQRTISQVFGRPLDAPMTIDVSAHERSASTKARPFLRPALADNLAKIGKIISRP